MEKRRRNQVIQRKIERLQGSIDHHKIDLEFHQKKANKDQITLIQGRIDEAEKDIKIYNEMIDETAGD